MGKAPASRLAGGWLLTSKWCDTTPLSSRLVLQKCACLSTTAHWLFLLTFFFGFYMFGKFLKFLQIKLTFLFLFKERILCHAVCNCHYPLYFFAQWCTVLRPLLSEYLENEQIRNHSAIDSLHVEVWVKSISNCCISLHLKCFLPVLCGWWEGRGRLEQKERGR